MKLTNRTEIIIYWCILHGWGFYTIYTSKDSYQLFWLIIFAIWSFCIFLSVIEHKNKEIAKKEKIISKNADIIYLLQSGWRYVCIDGFMDDKKNDLHVVEFWEKDGHRIEFFNTDAFLDGKKINIREL